MPSLFISHGAPTFALDPGDLGAHLTALGQSLPPLAAVVVLSPHWMTRDLVVGAHPSPETLYDFGGFPNVLYTLQYPAQGAPAVARRVQACLEAAGYTARLDPERGLDHGVWVPLMHLFPDANVPVVPISMPRTLDALGAYRLGEALRPLGEENILVIGSGSLTHNLMEFTGEERPEDDYVSDFRDWVHSALMNGDRTEITRYLAASPEARRAHPTPDHYVPLPFAVGASTGEWKIIPGRTRYGMLAMESYWFN